jgi:SnoaL-like domain
MADEIPMEAIARDFIDAFNRRDAEGLVALCDPEVSFHPTPLAGTHGGYRGHDGLRQWVADLDTSGLDHRVRVREVRRLDERRFLLLSEVWIDGELVSPSAMLARLGESGSIAEARAFLSDEETLEQIVLRPEESG